jgi:hypothetical protein
MKVYFKLFIKVFVSTVAVCAVAGFAFELFSYGHPEYVLHVFVSPFAGALIGVFPGGIIGLATVAIKFAWSK